MTLRKAYNLNVPLNYTTVYSESPRYESAPIPPAPSSTGFVFIIKIIKCRQTNQEESDAAQILCELSDAEGGAAAAVGANGVGSRGFWDGHGRKKPPG